MSKIQVISQKKNTNSSRVKVKEKYQQIKQIANENYKCNQRHMLPIYFILLLHYPYV